MEGSTIIETEVLGVSEKQATRKATGEPFTMYEIQVEDGTVYSTTFMDQANEAFKMIGKRAKLSVKVVQNGNWVNRYLQKVLGEAPAASTGFGATQPTQASGGFLGAPQTVVNNGVTSNTTLPDFNGLTGTAADDQQNIVDRAKIFEKEREANIHRQTASKVAAMLFVAGDSQVDFWDNVDSLIRFYQTGLKPLSVAIEQGT